jgi:hypothetical protein
MLFMRFLEVYQKDKVGFIYLPLLLVILLEIFLVINLGIYLDIYSLYKIFL